MAAKTEGQPKSPDEHDRIRAEIGKLIAESAKINAEARWYPFVATAGLFAAAVGFVKLLGTIF